MSISLPGFDTWLTDRLEECADDSGERVEAYVARAVATQMITDCERVDRASAGKLKAHLSLTGLTGQTATEGLRSVLADPNRLRALEATGLMDTPPEAAYARLARTTADALSAPVASLVLVAADRQFVAGAIGLGEATIRSQNFAESFDTYVVANGSPVSVDDARRHPLFKKWSSVRHAEVVAYLGMPLTDSAGHTVGTLSVSDRSPRRWTSGHMQILSDLAAVATERIFGA
ncbi:GAF domain-containing protein [Mycolicibacterium gilvum]|uniref:Signal transduction protein containing GAF and PtsI domains n=1 Tax=Mycolicibacterium gilvum (strain DSM 45189 / LMG 24558 / Spyr1) TaxID=278137 RepID=E6TPG2_MYCSR|nr:GAF domain-containing protein [Mycolicibacterium gilvum]ADU00664.1 signal transduction protein containing GAF and PtsI domains [Mycolicibacterium gilvum Spyr1]